MQNYTIQKNIATVRNGAVLLCQHNTTGRPVVIKRIKRDRFIEAIIAKEVHAYKTLQTTSQDAIGVANVAQLLDTFDDKKYCHLVLQHYAMGDLYNALKAMPQQRCTAEVAKNYFSQIALGLYHIHRHNIAHRDLSLENIFIDTNGTLKIGDFGLAIRVPMTVKCVVGKAYYMPAEIYDTRVGYDVSKVDVWSLGILLWMLLTGVPLVEKAAADDAVFDFLSRSGIRSLIDAWGLTSVIPDDAISMLELLLVIDPARRPSMTSVLTHPYCDCVVV
ncbi:kinase [Thraustotheca clavata]|uniref:Kinase n=1 Tax=Thraustotheca clavata TaxID=74557 RepID=A0A1V9ZV46_9STRA|nr:kinase [Thraustotheca clavata]